MPAVDVTVYYLEMLSHPRRNVPAPLDGLSVVQAKKPTVGFYRFLYNTVGEAYNWHSRGSRPDAELAELIQDPLSEIHVLYVDGTPAGFAELDRRTPGDIELIQFGLVPEFIGRGLGKWFLQWTIDHAWSYGPRRFWLHTCTLDHPAALSNYLKAGFTLFKQEVKPVTLAGGAAWRQGKPMKLELESGRIIERPTESEIRNAIETEEFAVLGSDRNTYIQFKRITPDCDAYMLEYQEGSLEAHFQAVEPPIITASQVIAAFIKYLRGDTSWRTKFEWEMGMGLI